MTEAFVPLNILYQDDALVVINKPAGLLVHRSKIDRHETQFAMQLLRDQIGQHVFPLHRLDKPTAGILVFGLSAEIAQKMMTVFVNNEVEKSYLAIVRGYIEDNGLIDYPLKEQLDKMTDSKARQDKEAQSAITAYQSLEKIELPYPVGRYQTARYSLVKLNPKTGRKHQLRRHMKHIFHPIVGDTTHGDGKQNQFFRTRFNARQLLLTATEMIFPHPLTQEIITIQCPLSGDFKKLVSQFGWEPYL